MGIQTPDQFIGQTVSHCYIEQFVGHDPAGAMYRAQQLRPVRPVLITIFTPPETLSPLAYQRFRTRFLREAASMVMLRHPHLLSLYGYGEWEGSLYLITPYRTEGSLLSQLQQQGAFSLAKTVTMLEQVTAGLEYAHNHGRSHGALNPAYLLVSEDHPLQIAGLGLLSMLERRNILPITENSQYLLTLAGTQLAAPKYMPPEVLQGQIADIRSDVYALGVILTELLSGSLLPKEAAAPEILQNRALPDSLKPVLQRALATNPNKRFQRVRDLLTDWTSAVERGNASAEYSQQALPVTPLPEVSITTLQDAGEQRREDKPWRATSFGQQPAPSQWPSPSRIPASANSKSKRVKNDNGYQRRQVVALLASGMALGAIASEGSILAYRLINGQLGPAASSTAPKGTIIGRTQQALNTAQAFNDLRVPMYRQRLLIHLSAGNFVVYKQGCTHTGVLVNYDPKTHLLVCPAHGAIFDPAQGGRVVKGPGNQSASSIPPLPQVSFHVNADGTITL